MTKFELQDRTKRFHVDVICRCGHLPRNAAGFETAKQLIRSAGSIGANYRAACRAKSRADFIYKLDVVLEESDESYYWLQIINEANLTTKECNTLLEKLMSEALQLVKIFQAADRPAKLSPTPKIKK